MATERQNMGVPASPSGYSAEPEPSCTVSAVPVSIPNACAACEKRGKTWQGSDPNCAFGRGAFDGGNWNCATTNAIRDICDQWSGEPPYGVARQYCDDQWYATINCDGVELPSGYALTLWVSWYKSRGRTEAMWLLSESSPPRPPTEADCLAITRFYASAIEAQRAETENTGSVHESAAPQEDAHD